jgi:precorrin-2 dehydrogenase/sirohydrochlorin ferrochelatase
MPNYYPAMLDVRGRAVIVIGGDQVAAEKAAGLAACGAAVRVISPIFCDGLLAQAEQGLVHLIQKNYAPGDLAGAFLVVAAVSDSQVADAIWEETRQGGQLLNVVDRPARCSFILPSILRQSVSASV